MRVLLTGASPGIGGATCLRLAADARRRGERASLAVCASRHQGRLQDLVRDLEALGARALPLAGDLADPAVPGRLAREAIDAFGGLDGVVSNAGEVAAASLLELDVAAWDRSFAVNARAHWLLARAAYPALAKSHGSIVLVGSQSGMQPQRGLGAYSPAKAALIMLGRTLAQEWALEGIRVNTVSPGLVRTPMTSTVLADADVARKRAELVPLGRIADADDIAAVIAFLLGEDARYVTGENLCVDGGLASSILSHIPGTSRHRRS